MERIAASHEPSDEASAESERRLRDFAEAASDWFWETDREHRFVFHSGRARTSGGKASTDMLGKTPWEWVGADPDRDPKWRRARALLQAHEPFRDFEFSFLDDHGRVRYRRASGKPIDDGTGAFKGYRGTVAAMTAELETRQAAERDEARLREALDAVSDGYALFDSEDRLILYNDKYILFPKSAQFDYSDARFADIIRETVRRGGFPDAKGREEEFVRERLRYHDNPEGVIEQRTGDQRWVQIRERKTWDKGTLTLVTDITELKSRERALRESEARFRNLIEGSIQGMLVDDRDRRPLFANRAAAQIFGYESAEELMALRSLEALVAPRDRARLREYSEARLKREEVPAQYDCQGLRRDGSTIWLHNMVTVVEWEGKPAFQVVLVDITNRKQAEEQLRQAQKMEAVGQLTSGVAHDFNNLLAVVLGNLQLLEKRVIGDQRLSELVAPAINAAKRGGALTHRLLAFSRKQALRPTAIDINSLVRGMLDLLQRSLGETVVVETNLGDGPRFVSVDVGQMETTLLNLALNARDAMLGGGNLLIETATVGGDDYRWLSDHCDTASVEYVVVRVRDSGIGMPPEVIEKAFEPFFTTKVTGEGSGLGLSMVYGFVKQSGGHVTIDSQIGHGSEVTIYLPRLPAAQVAATPKHADPGEPHGKGETVLVVEDDTEVREVVARMLASLDYRPLVADSGGSGLAMLQQAPHVHLLITDVVLRGELSGPDLADKARQRWPGLKVLYISGYFEDEMFRRARFDERAALIGKPFDRESLARMVDAVLGG